ILMLGVAISGADADDLSRLGDRRQQFHLIDRQIGLRVFCEPSDSIPRIAGNRLSEAGDIATKLVRQIDDSAVIADDAKPCTLGMLKRNKLHEENPNRLLGFSTRIFRSIAASG